jgi:DNA polymerase-3 subunit alpha
VYKIIERPPGEPTETVLGDQTLPVPCLVEDGESTRWAVLGSVAVSGPLWRWLLDVAPTAVLAADSEVCLGAPMGEFQEHVVEHSGSYSVPGTLWREYRPGMTYRELRSATPLMAEPEPEPTDFVHLHTHSEFSGLDGLSRIQEIVDAVVRDGNPAVAITDHGNPAAHPALQLACDKAGIKPIFGVEAYFVEDVEVKERDYWHLVLWAMDDTGLRNLWAATTESEARGKYYKPRMDWDILQRHSEGLMASTACLRGPVLHPYLSDDPEGTEKGLHNLARLKDIFGDRLYIELHANQLPQQIRANEWLVHVARDYDVPLVAVVDSHYAEPEHKHDHRLWLSIQTNSDVADETDLFGGDQDYHLLTRDEVAKSLAYLDDIEPGVVEEAIANTVVVADRCTARIAAKGGTPVFSRATAEHPDPVTHDVERLFDACMANWDRRTRGKRESQKVYLERFQTEMRLLVSKGFSGYFLMVADLVTYAKSNGVLVGPGRGSGGGSLVAYLLGITEIDPVEYDLLFARFMTEGRTELPDFDIDFPSSRKQFMLDYVTARWGAEHVATVGTHLRLQSKGVVKDCARALKSQLPEDHWRDIEAVSAIIGEAEAGTAGLGMAWDDLWAQFGEVLTPYRDKYPELFAYADRLHGRLKTYGAHPAGVIIDPDDPLSSALPLRNADGKMVTQFDMNALTDLGFVKFDLLNLRTLDTLQETVDLIEATTGHRVDVYSWTDELADPQVYEEISAGWTLGMFQIETQSGTRMCKRFRPETVADMSDVITLVRPGPMRSGLTETFLLRREGIEEVHFPDPRLEKVLAKTNGCIIYQENVMATVMELAGYGSDEADKVRKILGKKKVDAVLAEGQKFVAQAAEMGMDTGAAQDLWAQMAEFAKYSFGGAHAIAYAILGVWTAWFKVHYPVHFLTAALSTVKDERIPEFVEEARRMGYRVLPPDINVSGPGFTTDGMAVRYGLSSVKGVGDAAVEAILAPRAEQPFTSFADFLARKGPKCNAGHVKTLARIGAFDSLEPNRRGLLERLELEETASKGTDVCLWKSEQPKRVTWLPKPMTAEQRADLSGVLDEEGQQYLQQLTTRTEWALPCDYPWASEPEVLGRTGKPTARKAPPKKCSRGCRQFAPAELPTLDSFEPYTAADIRAIEADLLGVFLSSTPFDDIPAEALTELSTGVDVLTGEAGTYLIAAYLKSIRKKNDRTGSEMAFTTVDTPQGSLDVTVFGRYFDAYRAHLTVGALVLMAVKKNDRGISLVNLEPLEGNA